VTKVLFTFLTFSTAQISHVSGAAFNNKFDAGGKGIWDF
jgi:hypothetical protein